MTAVLVLICVFNYSSSVVKREYNLTRGEYRELVQTVGNADPRLLCDEQGLDDALDLGDAVRARVVGGGV